MRYHLSRVLCVLMLWLGAAAELSAAQCSDIFQSSNGINEELEEGNRLSYDTDTWPEPVSWPPSGTTLSSGDYYYEEEDLDSNYVLNIASGATVRIFVDGDLEIGNNALFNASGQTSQLLLLVNGDLEVKNNAVFKGILYSEDELELKNNSLIQGVVASEDEIDRGKNADVTYDPGAVDSGLLDGLCESPNKAILPALDTFESYPAGSSIDGRNGGSNWGGAWTANTGQTLLDTSADRLEFLASNGLSIRSDTTLEISGNNNRMVTRPLSGSYEGETVYLSMLVRFQGEPGNNDFLGFWLQNPDFGESPQFGIKVNEGGGGRRDFFVRLDTDGAYATEFEPGQTYLLAARFSKNGLNYYQQGDLWVNPQCTQAPPPTTSASITTSPETRVSAVSEVGLRSANLSGGARVQVGQVAVGEQWSDVVSCECYQNGLEATYYNNYSRNQPFPDEPDLTRLDARIDFNWGGESPDPAINRDQFAAQWQGSIEVPETGQYRFTARTDDGVRLWIDDLDTPLIDDWFNRSAANSSASITLQAGRRYAIRMQYYENGGVAEARLSWQRPDGTNEIVPERFLFGCLPVAAPRLASAGAVCGASDLVELAFLESQRSRPLLAASLENTGFYRIERVSDGQAIPVTGAVAGEDGYSVLLQLSEELSLADTYRVEVTDIQDVGGAVIEPNPSELEFAAATAGLATEYWNNRNLGGSPVFSEVTEQINNDWRNGSPAPGVVNNDRFSVRWTGFIVPPETGVYRFQTRTDDGVRLYVDDLVNPVIDEWRDFAPTNHTSGDIFLEKGRSYSIRMEMYENRGGAVAQLRWRRPDDDSFRIIPPGAFFQCPSAGSTLDHFRIVHGGVGVTCQPTPVSIEARNAAGDIVNDYAGEVALSTSTGEGFWQASGGASGALTVVPGNTGRASYQFDPADGGVATLALGHTRPATVNLDVTDGNVAELPSADPDLVVQRAGFIFHQGNDFSTPIGPQISGKASDLAPGAQDLRLTAVRESDETGACEAFLVGSQTVEIGQVCETPGSCSAVSAADINGVTVARNASGNGADATPVAVDFGDAGTSSAPITLRYNDAGLISLFARMALTDDQGNPTGEAIVGSSGPFAVVPAGFCVAAPDPALSCPPADASCSAGAVAGEVFTLRVSAVGWEGAGEAGAGLCDNPITPNFEYSGLSLEHQLLAPVTGQPGAILSSSLDMLPSSEGRRDVNQSVSEVGVFEFAIPAGQPYLGQALPGGNSAPIGRFTPAGFRVDVSDAGTLDAFCAGSPGFTYTGQSFGWSVSPELALVPLALDEVSKTENYLIGDFMKLSGAGVGRASPSEDRVARLADDSGYIGVGLDIRPGAITRDVTQTALMFRYSNDDSFLIPKSLNTRVQPFRPALSFAVTSVQDEDAVTVFGSQPMPVEFEPASDGEIRFGRLEMSNVYGPENSEQALSMQTRVAYWNGNRFVLNAPDSCTAWDTSIPAPLVNDEQFHELLNESETGVFTSGAGPALRLLPKGVRGEERVSWQVPVWLKGYWDPEAPGNLLDPYAWATFGVYRGNDRIIYWREAPVN